MKTAYLNFVGRVIEQGRHIERDVRSRNHLEITSIIPQHAGGVGYEANTAAATGDTATGAAGGESAPVAAASDDVGDGDPDPDSDRRKLPSPKSNQPLERKRVNVSTRIIRMAELKARVGLSRSTIYELIKSGTFPPSISLGPRAVGWLSNDLDRWIESRIQSPDA